MEPPARLTPVHRCAVAFFVALFAAMVWPVYPLFDTVRPIVLGMPFSLFYQVVLLTLGFVVLLGLYLHDARTGSDD